MAIAQTGLSTKINDDVYKPDLSGYNALGTNLAHLLGIKETGQNEKELSAQKAKEKDQAQQNTISRLPELLKQSGDYGKASLTEDGAAVDKGAEAKLIANRASLDSKAVKGMHDTYTHGVGKIQDQLQAASELTDAVQDPTQLSQGLARTLALKMMGMSRYNGDEAKQILPGSLQALWSKAGAAVGADTTPLTAQQASDLIKFRDSSLKGLSQKHDALKQNAISTYEDSQVADSSKTDNFRKTLGAPIDTQIQSLMQQKAGPSKPNPITQPAAPGGFLGGLAGLLGFNKAPAGPTPASAPNSAPQPPQGNSTPPGVPTPQGPSQQAPGGPTASPMGAAPKPAPYGPTVIQDGITHHWNPISGQYE